VNNVKIINITNGAFAALLLASSVAGADAQYPASDFQPKVLYQDAEYKHQGASAATAAPSSAKPADSKYPASDFQPKVVYSDPGYKAPSSTGAAAASRPQNKSVETDSKYPASDFQPKVVYSDPGYKAPSSTGAAAASRPQNKSVESSSAAAEQQSTAAVEEAKPAAEGKKEESNFVYLIGLAVLAFVGVVFFKKQARPEGHAAQGAARTVVAGATGVAKYLNRKGGTGVSRYLEQHVKSVAASAPLTGVAKYMASQKPSTESASSKPASRVEKYLRDRG